MVELRGVQKRNTSTITFLLYIYFSYFFRAWLSDTVYLLDMDYKAWHIFCLPFFYQVFSNFFKNSLHTMVNFAVAGIFRKIN